MVDRENLSRTTYHDILQDVIELLWRHCKNATKLKQVTQNKTKT